MKESAINCKLSYNKLVFKTKYYFIALKGRR